jgi:hypothetical protein
MHLIPAYGRDYTSKAAVISDLKANKDFIWSDGPGRPLPINLPQIPAHSFPLQVRFRNLRTVAVVQRAEVGL